MPPSENQKPPEANQPSQFFQGPTEHGYPTPSPAPTPPPQPPKKNKKTLLIIIIAAAATVLILGGVTVFAVLSSKSKKKPTTQNNSQQQNTTPPEKKDNEIQARNLDDFNEVCNGTRVLNSASYTTGTKPHPIALFISSPVDPQSYLPYSVFFKDTQWAADSKVPDKTQLVACFKRVATNEKLMDCKVSSGGQLFTVPLVAVTYKMTVYEAQSAKEVGSKEIKATSGVCESVGAFTQSNPTYYSKPTDADIVANIAEFVTKDVTQDDKKDSSQGTGQSGNSTQNPVQ